jgi:2'-5' RNA ligase superfamily
VVHSVELVFDADTDGQLRGVWDDLDAIGVRSQAAVKSPSNRPHVTLVVAQQMTDGVDDVLVPVLSRLPLACRIGAPKLFGSGPFTLVRLVVPSDDLLALHSEVHRVCVPFMSPAPLPHAEPGNWTAHVTLARRVDAAELPRVFGMASVDVDIDASAVGLRHWDGNSRVEHPIG